LFGKDENFESIESNFKTDYPSQNIMFSPEKLYKTMPVAEAVEDKAIWETINKLVAIVKENGYKVGNL
jgi:hypothetical protein